MACTLRTTLSVLITLLLVGCGGGGGADADRPDSGPGDPGGVNAGPPPDRIVLDDSPLLAALDQAPSEVAARSRAATIDDLLALPAVQDAVFEARFDVILDDPTFRGAAPPHVVGTVESLGAGFVLMVGSDGFGNVAPGDPTSAGEVTLFHSQAAREGHEEVLLSCGDGLYFITGDAALEGAGGSSGTLSRILELPTHHVAEITGFGVTTGVEMRTFSLRVVVDPLRSGLAPGAWMLFSETHAVR